MKPDTATRARVQKLLSGNFQTDDLTRLFLFSRDRCQGRESVQEIGDFVAHHSERTKGMFTRRTRDWVTRATHFSKTPRVGYDPSRLPPNIEEVMRSGLRIEDDVHLRISTGFNQMTARKPLDDICTKLVKNSDGTFLLVPQLFEPRQWELAKFLVTTISLTVAFSGDELFSDLEKTLRHNEVLKLSEVDQFSERKSAILLFALSVMHNCQIRINDAGDTAKLETSKVGPLHTIPRYPPNLLVEVATIFQTDLIPEDHCEPTLLAEDAPWEFDLELKPNLRLGIL